MAASPDMLIASCVISPSRDKVGVDVGARVGEIVVGTGVDGATIGAGLVGMGLGAKVGLKVVGLFDGPGVGIFVAKPGVGDDVAITGDGVSGSGDVGALVGGKVDGSGVAGEGTTIGARVGGDVTGLIVGVIVGFGIVGISVTGPGPGSDDIAGALVGSRLVVDSMLGVRVGSLDDNDAGSLVGESTLETEESDLLSDGGLRAFVLDVDEAFVCFDDLLPFEDLVDAVPFDIFIFFRRRFFRCCITFLRLLCRSRSSFALSIFLGNRFGILLLLFLPSLLLLLLLWSSLAFIR